MARKIRNLDGRRRFQQRLLLGLVLRPVRLFCEHCEQYVPSSMHWRCSHCAYENRRTKFYSFLNKCQRCKRPPKSYICPRCGEPNFLDRDNDASHPARSVTALAAEPVTDQTDPREERRRKHAERKERKEQEIEISELDVRLARLKASSEFKKQVTTREKLEASFAEHDAHTMGVHIIEMEQRGKNAEQYKDNPEMRKRADESLTHWVEKQI